MATSSLDTAHYTIKEFQLLVKDAPVVPAEIQPFVGIQFRRSGDIYRAFKDLGEGLRSMGRSWEDRELASIRSESQNSVLRVLV